MNRDSQKNELINRYNKIRKEEDELDKLIHDEENSEYDNEENPDEYNEEGDPIDDNEEDIDESTDEDSPENEEEESEDEDDEEEETPSEEDEDNSQNVNNEDDNENSSEEDNVNESEADSDSSGELNSDRRRELGPKRREDGKSSEDDTSKDDGDSSKGLKDKAVDIAKGAAKNNETIQQLSRVKAAATSAITGIKSAAGMLVNPIFWKVVLIIAAVILIAVTLISISDTIGGNDYNKLCDQSGVGSVMIEDDVDDHTRQSAIASWLMSTPFEVLGGQPMSREQAMGVMGNFIEESGGANPKTIQGGYANWETCDNDCVAAFSGGGKAVGILQWDGNLGDPRRDNLVKLAKAEGVQWYDLNIQLKHLKMELDAEGDHTYENHQIKKSGFLDGGRSIEDYTVLWSKYIERCGKCRNDDRIASALAFDAKFTGSVSGLSSQCVGGLAVSSNITELAKQIAWTREEKAAGKGYGNCSSYHECGLSFSKPEYVELKRKVEAETGKHHAGKDFLASCDALVATLVRGSGIDVTYPYGNSNQQISYMDKPDSGWERVSCQDRQPGDVFGQNGHIMIYAGDIDGKDTMVSASILTRSAHMSNISCSGDKFRGDNLTVQGWRKVN